MCIGNQAAPASPAVGVKATQSLVKFILVLSFYAKRKDERKGAQKYKLMALFSHRPGRTRAFKAMCSRRPYGLLRVLKLRITNPAGNLICISV